MYLGLPTKTNPLLRPPLCLSGEWFY